MPDGKRLMDMAANTAILGAFACEAPELAALIGGVQFLMDVVWPAAQPAPTQYAPVDHAYLSAALEGLKSEIIDAIWWAFSDQQEFDVLHISDTYWGNLKQFQQMNIGTDPASDVELDGYFRTAGSLEYPLVVLDDARAYLTYDSANDRSLTPLQVAQHYTDTIGMYALIGSTMLTYLKTSVAWRRAVHVFPHLQYEKYKVDLAKWDGYTPKQQQDHPEWKPAPVADPNADGQHPLYDWVAWIKRQESGVPKLIETANTLIGYAETGTPATPTAPATKGLQVEMLEHWNKAIDNIKSRLDKISVAPDVPRGMYYLTGIGDAGPFWVVDTEVNRPYITHTVSAGDTLESIAKLGRPGNRPEAADVFFMNLDVLTINHSLGTGFNSVDQAAKDSKFLQAGLVLKIPYQYWNPPATRELARLEWAFRAGALLAYEWEASMDRFALSGVTLDDITDFGKTIQLWKRARASVQFTPYTVAPGDTLASISAQFYQGDASQATKIYKFNSDTLTSPTQALMAGKVINIPDKDVLSDIE